MAAPAFPLLLLASLLPSTAAAAASLDHHGAPATHAHLHHHGHGHAHHHRSPSAMTATARFDTAPSMHQNRIEPEENRQSLGALGPFFTPVAAQAPSSEEAMAAMAAAAEAADADTTAPPDVPQPPSSPPPSFVATADPPSPASRADTARWSAPPEAATAPPPIDEPAATTTTTLPLASPYHEPEVSSPPPPAHAAAAGMASSGGDDLGLQQLAKVLASLGYNEMASAATLLADSAPAVTWPGAITVFAAPDVLLQAVCPGCSRRHLLLDHMALGYFPYAELAAAPTVKLPSASVGFCLDVAAERRPFSVHHTSLYVDGVEVSHPELYDDGRYVVHGLRGIVPPLSHASCVEGTHHHQVQVHHHGRRHHHFSARSAAASVVRIMIRDAISRLRDSGFGFVALAMRVKFAELEKLANLTVFALDDQAIFTGEGHGYVSAVRFHIVPGHRLTCADLLRLRPGTILPTLAGEDQKLVITRGAGSATDEVRVNYIPVKEPDAVINSRVTVHGIYVPFPRLHLANLAASVAVASTIQMNGTCDDEGPFGDCASTAMTSATIPNAQGYGEGQ